MTTNATNIIAHLSCVLMWLFFGLVFGLLNTKSIKLDISPDDTKFIYIWTHHIYTYKSMTHNLEPEIHVRAP